MNLFIHRFLYIYHVDGILPISRLEGSKKQRPQRKKDLNVENYKKLLTT